MEIEIGTRVSVGSVQGRVVSVDVMVGVLIEGHNYATDFFPEELDVRSIERAVSV